MEMTSHHSNFTEGGVIQNSIQSECILTQPTANGRLPHHDTDEATLPLSDRSEVGDLSDDSLTGSSSANDVCKLLSYHPISAPLKLNGADKSTVSPGPVRAPPPPSSTYDRHSCSLHPPHHRHHRHQNSNQKRLSSTKSHASLKSDAAHIKEVAGDDCCVHCLLACLFCEMLSMCFAVGECLACGVGGAECCNATDGCCCCCCCCVEAAGEAACTEEACQAVLDCGILEDCCGSSDCMEICLECCSICFPS